MIRWPRVQRKPNSHRHLLCSYMETDPGWWIYIHLSPAHLCKGQEIEFLHLLLAEPIAHSSASQESLHFSRWWPDVTVLPLQWKQETGVFLYNPVKPKPAEIMIRAWNDETVKSVKSNNWHWTIKRLKCFCRSTKTDSVQYQCSSWTVDLHGCDANPMNCLLAKLNV